MFNFDPTKSGRRPWLPWSSIIKVVCIWLLLQFCIDLVSDRHNLPTTVASLFFYISGVISGVGLMYSWDTRRAEKRKRILELVKLIRETYKEPL